MRRLACVLALLSGGVGCASVGAMNDGSSLSYGATNDGFLKNPAKLPPFGDGYVIPTTWRMRGNVWGTDDLVVMVVSVARRVAREQPGSVLYVGDLSPERGGRSLWHRSHQTGRDVDLMFYMLDERGRPAPPPTRMLTFREDGASRAVTPRGRRLYFDVARNWLLVRALLEHPWVEVQYVFVAEWLKQRLLAYAREAGAPADLIRHADEVMLQPLNALPHDDHFHVRVYCSADDRALGCREHGPLRWLKKDWKYQAWPRQEMAMTIGVPADRARPVLARPFCLMVGQRLVAALAGGAGTVAVR